MFTDLASIREAVKERLTPLLPATWEIEPTIEARSKRGVPVLYIEFVKFDTSDESGDLARGQVSAKFNLIIVDPRTDTAKGEDAVDEHVLRVVRAIDPQDDIFWTTADLGREPTGEMRWAVSCSALVQTPNPDNEE